MAGRQNVTEVADGLWHYAYTYNLFGSYFLVGKTGALILDSTFDEYTEPVALDKSGMEFKDNDLSKYYRTLKEEIERCITATLGNIPPTTRCGTANTTIIAITRCTTPTLIRWGGSTLQIKIPCSRPSTITIGSVHWRLPGRPGKLSRWRYA